MIFYEFKDMKDSKDNKQTYINGTVGTRGISCIQLSPSKRYLAFAEEAEYGVINIYELRHKVGEKGGGFLDTPVHKKTLVGKNDSGYYIHQIKHLHRSELQKLCGRQDTGSFDFRYECDNLGVGQTKGH